VLALNGTDALKLGASSNRPYSNTNANVCILVKTLVSLFQANKNELKFGDLCKQLHFWCFLAGKRQRLSAQALLSRMISCVVKIVERACPVLSKPNKPSTKSCAAKWVGWSTVLKLGCK
jgi:hypothetical protein